MIINKVLSLFVNVIHDNYVLNDCLIGHDNYDYDHQLLYV